PLPSSPARDSTWTARAQSPRPGKSGQANLGQSHLRSARSAPPRGPGAALDASDIHREERSRAREYRPGVSCGALVACGPQLRSVRIRPRLPGFGPGGDPVGPAPEADRGTLPGSPRVRILLTVPCDE